MKVIKNGRDKYVLVVAPPSFPGWKHAGKYCYQHHLVWWAVKGFAPSGDQVIHHLNENPTDNRIENLELTTRSEHSRHHALAKGRGPTIHGTQTAYRHHKCRCDQCRNAQNNRINEYRWKRGLRKKRSGVV